VPLHADAELRFGALDRFDHAVSRHRRHDERRRHALDRLVVTAVDATRVELLRSAERGSQDGVGRDAHIVCRRLLWFLNPVIEL